METALKKDDLVTLANHVRSNFPDGTIFRVIKVPVGSRQVNYRVEDIRSGRRLVGPREVFVLAVDGASDVKVNAVTSPDRLWIGQVVTVSGPRWPRSMTEPYVIIGDRADDTYKITKLGGDEGHYFSWLLRQMLTLVDVLVKVRAGHE